MNAEQQKFIDWISQYVVDDDFGTIHFNALKTITCHMNNSFEDEQAILEFASKLKSGAYET